jgi:Mn2+/Fe2+ NRAMP family transporter
LSLPIFEIIHLATEIRKKYGIAETIRVLVSASLVIGFLATFIVRSVRPYIPLYFVPSPGFLLTLAVNVGALIMPSLPFLQASAKVEKVSHIRKQNTKKNSGDLDSRERTQFKRVALKSMRMETMFGSLV